MTDYIKWGEFMVYGLYGLAICIWGLLGLVTWSIFGVIGSYDSQNKMHIQGKHRAAWNLPVLICSWGVAFYLIPFYIVPQFYSHIPGLFNPDGVEQSLKYIYPHRNGIMTGFLVVFVVWNIILIIKFLFSSRKSFSVRKKSLFQAKRVLIRGGGTFYTKLLSGNFIINVMFINIISELLTGTYNDFICDLWVYLLYGLVVVYWVENLEKNKCMVLFEDGSLLFSTIWYKSYCKVTELEIEEQPEKLIFTIQKKYQFDVMCNERYRENLKETLKEFGYREQEEYQDVCPE